MGLDANLWSWAIYSFSKWVPMAQRGCQHKKVMSRVQRQATALSGKEHHGFLLLHGTACGKSPVIAHLSSFSYWLPRPENITLVYYLLGPLPRLVQGPSSFYQPLNHLLPPALHADQQVLDEHHVLLLTEVLQVGSSFVQFYYLLTVRIHFIGKDLSRKRRKSLDTRGNGLTLKAYHCHNARVQGQRKVLRWGGWGVSPGGIRGATGMWSNMPHTGVKSSRNKTTHYKREFSDY